MSLEVPSSSTEIVWVPVRDDHPTAGEINLSAVGIEVALPVDGVTPSAWTTTTWETGTWRRGEDRYYLAKLQVGTGGFTLSAGSTYRAWVRVGGASGAVVKGGTIKAINT